jgi:hypothetical protein
LLGHITERARGHVARTRSDEVLLGTFPKDPLRGKP